MANKAPDGLSPPTRGNPLVQLAAQPRRGSIPAHAGEPSRAGASCDDTGVYPRPRGGTFSRLMYSRGLWGLSPPTRGNRGATELSASGMRSIPAHAGEPDSPIADAPSDAVYPRPRGGTHWWARLSISNEGLSPPTRGNRRRRRVSVDRRRSIPAHAGEPSVLPEKSAPLAVYPRPRGGTGAGVQLAETPRGLSPPTRGNPESVKERTQELGSIPAHAGEPRQRERGRRGQTVYPRPRGGTFGGACWRAGRYGLSPPTRGNPCAASNRAKAVGSIPAHAGEPICHSPGCIWESVYPRPRGGTLGVYVYRHSDPGLSPPTRGNPSIARRPPFCSGSIPAHAGEPCQAKFA